MSDTLDTMSGHDQQPDSADAPGADAPGVDQQGSTKASGGAHPGGGQQPGRPSGLRDPQRAVRSLGAATLALEALVLLLAIQPMRVLGGNLTGATIGVIVALAVGAVVLAGMMRRNWAWHAATGLQVALLAGGFLHWSLAGLGVIFGLVWLYVLHVRRLILG